MKLLYINKLIWFLCLAAGITSCKKYLDEKQSQSLSTPDTFTDLQAMLDNQYIYRYGVRQGQTMADEFYMPYANWQTRTDIDKLGYIWDANIDDYPDWIQQYSLVLIANTVLDRVDKLASDAPGAQANDIKGQALFLRAHCFYQLAQLYAPQYDPSTAGADLGIVLRLEPDFNITSQRASVRQTYDQILSDLQQSITLLPSTISYKTRASKPAAYALLARTYLQIGDYQKAKTAADQCLALYNTLMDYNDPAEVNPASASIPILNRGILNKEVIYYHNDEGSLTTSPSARIDSVLYNSYDVKDIRKGAFFRQNTGENTYRFKGSLSGQAGWFTGFGTAEVYLTRAECYVRLGNIPAGMQDLNTLLVKRYQTGNAPSFTPATQEDALKIVLNERKKEMVYRGVRWSDIKRLNKNPATALTLKRDLNGTIYTLPPNDKRYALLIPSTVLQVVNLPQNPR